MSLNPSTTFWRSGSSSPSPRAAKRSKLRREKTRGGQRDRQDDDPRQERRDGVTDTFSRIAPAGILGFIAGQLLGALAAMLLFRRIGNTNDGKA